MNRKKLPLHILYLISLIGVFVVILFVSKNTFLNILLSIYLIIFSAIYIYINRQKA